MLINMMLSFIVCFFEINKSFMFFVTNSFLAFLLLKGNLFLNHYQYL